MGRRAVFDDPALRLANNLLDVGRADLHRRIVAALHDSPLEESYVGDVQDQLAAVVTDQRVAERDRREASRLIGIGDDLLAAIGRSGTVLMVWRRSPQQVDHPGQNMPLARYESDGIYQGSWGDIETFESSPELRTLAEALNWAQRRAPHVIVRPWWNDDTHYWAGDGPPPDGMDALPDHHR
ncbi:hypothetical protein ACTHQY_04595 [Rhodococcoides corynebacterioides]|uniref:hypothetical protein n=1 Tax=Rhodococcoides corynebacterioides TaxID=53972 RepID=UPI003F7CE4F4